MHKQCQVVCLPTNEKAPFVLQLESEVLSYANLYILSDDKIEVGDYILYTDDSKELVQCTAGRLNAANQEKWVQKIIASTDPSLNLPSLSFEFLLKYCEKQPKEVLVKYIGNLSPITNDFDGTSKLIVVNNQISIKEVEKTYSREEIQPLVDALIKAQKLLKESADAGYYPLFALQENGGEGFKFMTKALEAFL